MFESSLMISITLDSKKVGVVGAKVSYRWHVLCSPPTTVLGHVVVLRPSPLPQCPRNVLEELAQVGGAGTQHPEISLRVPLPMITAIIN